MGEYRTIVADPPWHYEGFATGPGDPRKGRKRQIKASALPYGSMTLAEIKALPLQDIAAQDAFMFLWTTNRYLPASFDVLTAWGFDYRQTLTWHKTGNPSPFGGSVAPIHTEFLLVGVRGAPGRLGRLKSSIVPAPKPYKHSAKPECFQDAIESVAPGPYLEMFARRERLGWDTWGNESANSSGLELAA